MTETRDRAEVLHERLRDLSPDRAADLDARIADTNASPTERYLETVLGIAMERHRWTCPCGDAGELSVASNADAPGPASPTIHNDEGESMGLCSECDEELDLVTLVPILVWHVAQAGVFGIVDDDGNFTSADEFERESKVEAEHSREQGGSGVAMRYQPFSDPRLAAEAATRAMRRDPEDLIQIIPEALSAAWV